MSSAPMSANVAVKGIRIAIGIGGLLALVVGVLVLVWPGKTAMVVTALIAIYAIVAGAIYAAVGGMSKTKSGWARVGHVLLGIVFFLAGVIAFTSLSQTAVWLGMFLGILVGVMWIVEGIVALTTLSDVNSRFWAILFAVLSIVAGVVLLFAPVWGAVMLWMLIGISLVVLGSVNIIRAIAFGRA